MIEFKVLLFILLIHWLADFALQSHEQATKKATDDIQLFNHVAVYSIVWGFASYCILPGFAQAFLFMLVTFVTHFIVDYNTSRLGKQFWDKKDLHNGFVIVGFDQILHYIQLFLTYIWLS